MAHCVHVAVRHCTHAEIAVDTGCRDTAAQEDLHIRKDSVGDADLMADAGKGSSLAACAPSRASLRELCLANPRAPGLLQACALKPRSRDPSVLCEGTMEGNGISTYRRRCRRKEAHY